MPDEYISREAALMKLMQDGCSAKNLQSISDMPAADDAEVVHGQWIKDDFLSDDVNNAEKCSRCGELIGWFGNLPNYCPNCGARMDGGNGAAYLALEAETTQIIDGCCTACGAFMDCCEAAEYKFCPYCAKRIV